MGTSTGLGGLCGQDTQGKKPHYVPKALTPGAASISPSHSGEHREFTKIRAGKPQQPEDKHPWCGWERDGKGRSPESPQPHGSLRWGQVNIEDDLRPRRGPLQVSAHPNPQLVDVSVLSIVRRDRQRVRDGQQLGEAGKRVRSLSCRQCTWLDSQKPATAALRKTARHQATLPPEWGAEEGLCPRDLDTAVGGCIYLQSPDKPPPQAPQRKHWDKQTLSAVLSKHFSAVL